MTQYNEELERRVIALVAADRIEIPISSLSGKLKRMKPKLAQAVGMPDITKRYDGERVYAQVKEEDEQKARGMKEGIDAFAKKFPRYGKILNGLIEEKRVDREQHLYFGMQEGRRLTADDYLTVMSNLGFGESSAKSLYHELVEVSRGISKKRDEERSIMLGTTLGQYKDSKDSEDSQ